MNVIKLLRRLYYAKFMYSGFEYGGLIYGELVANCVAYGIKGELRKAYDYPKKSNNLKRQKFIGYAFTSRQCGLCSFTYLPLRHFRII